MASFIVPANTPRKPQQNGLPAGLYCLLYYCTDRRRHGVNWYSRFIRFATHFVTSNITKPCHITNTTETHRYCCSRIPYQTLLLILFLLLIHLGSHNSRMDFLQNFTFCFITSRTGRRHVYVVIWSGRFMS